MVKYMVLLPKNLWFYLLALILFLPIAGFAQTNDPPKIIYNAQQWGNYDNPAYPNAPRVQIYTPQTTNFGFNGYYFHFSYGALIDPAKDKNKVQIRAGHGTRASFSGGFVYDFGQSYLEWGPEFARADIVNGYEVRGTNIRGKIGTRIYSYGLFTNYYWDKNNITPYTGLSFGRAHIESPIKVAGSTIRFNGDANQLQFRLGLKYHTDFGDALLQYQGGWYDNIFQRNYMVHGLEAGYNLAF